MPVINSIGTVLEVSCSAKHEFSKQRTSAIRIAAGHGVVGDAHAGELIQHRSRMEIDPDQPNLRQVHLMPVELLEELDRAGSIWSVLAAIQFCGSAAKPCCA